MSMTSLTQWFIDSPQPSHFRSQHQAYTVAAAERDPNGMCCPTEFAEALKDCFRQADKQLLHWLERKHP